MKPRRNPAVRVQRMVRHRESPSVDSSRLSNTQQSRSQESEPLTLDDIRALSVELAKSARQAQAYHQQRAGMCLQSVAEIQEPCPKCYKSKTQGLGGKLLK